MPTWRAVVTIDNAALGGRGTNTWHVRSASTVVGDVLEADALMELVHDFYTGCLGVISSATTIRFNGEYTGVGDDDGEFGQGPGWDIVNGGAGLPLPPSQCLCVNWRGQSGDRSRRGRTFLGPINKEVLDSDGTPTNTGITVVRAAAAELVGAVRYLR